MILEPSKPSKTVFFGSKVPPVDIVTNWLSKVEIIIIIFKVGVSKIQGNTTKRARNFGFFSEKTSKMKN